MNSYNSTLKNSYNLNCMKIKLYEFIQFSFMVYFTAGGENFEDFKRQKPFESALF